MNKLSNCILAIIMIAAALLLSVGGTMLNIDAKRILLTIVAAAVGAAFAVFVNRCGANRVLKLASWLAGGLVLVLFLTRFTPLGCSVHGSRRYFHLLGFHFTPALLSMPIICLFWAHCTTLPPVSVKRWLLPLLVTTAVTALVLAEPFISMAGMIAVFALVLLVLWKPGPKSIVLCAAAAVLIGAASVAAVLNHRAERGQKDFYRHLFSPDPQTNYHTWSLHTTLKHSAFVGKHHIPETMPHHIPNAEHDAPLVAGCGEFGYIFMIAALLLTSVIIACGVVLTIRNRRMPDRLLTGGMTASIALPALINTAMMFGLLPMGGVAFPFLSHGGTAMLSNFFALGLIVVASIHGCKDFTPEKNFRMESTVQD